MKTIIAIILWCILFTLSWPLAIILFFFLGFFWLILLPFRVVGFTLEVLFKVIGAILMLPLTVLRRI